MTQPRITVITPSLNQAQFLERAMCSVLDQGYDNLEYLIADGGSTDRSVKLIELYQDDLAWWHSAPDRGPADAINQALAHATGDLVAIVNADDLLLPCTLQAVADAMTGPEAPAWVVGRCLQIDAGDQMLGAVSPSLPDSLASYLMHDSGLLPLAASFFRRDLLQAHGPLDEGLEFAFDYEYCCRLLAAGVRPALAPQLLTAQREHPARRSAQHTLQHGMETIAAARHYADRLPLTERAALWVNCDYRERIYALAEAEVHGPEARRFLWQHLLRRPWWLTDQSLRHTLLHGVKSPLPEELARPAA